MKRVAVVSLLAVCSCLSACGLVEFAIDGNHHLGTPQKDGEKSSSPECDRDPNSEECLFLV
jgi:hypothetical protein